MAQKPVKAHKGPKAAITKRKNAPTKSKATPTNVANKLRKV